MTVELQIRITHSNPPNNKTVMKKIGFTIVDHGTIICDRQYWMS